MGAPAGRPGEWEALSLDDVKIMVVGGNEHLEMDEHKTALTQGVLGKFIPPGTKKAMELFVTLPNRSGLFFETQSADKEGVQMNVLLKRFGRDYLPNAHAACPTLLRKVYTSLVDDTEGAAKELVASFNAHLAKTGDDVYNLSKADADARKAKAAVDHLLGGPVPWPEGELTREKMAARIAALKKQGMRRRTSTRAATKGSAAPPDAGPGDQAIDPASQQRVLAAVGANSSDVPLSAATAPELPSVAGADPLVLGHSGAANAGGSPPEALAKAKRSRRTKAEMEAAQAGDHRHASRVYLNVEQQAYVFTKWNDAHCGTNSLHGLLPWFTDLVQQGVRDGVWTLTQAPTPKGLSSLVRRAVFERNEESEALR